MDDYLIMITLHISGSLNTGGPRLNSVPSYALCIYLYHQFVGFGFA
jgi:hypothetical protein